MARAPKQRAVACRTEHQECVDESRGLCRNAQRLEGVDIQTADLDILHAFFLHRRDRAFAPTRRSFRADDRVVLVFNLQHIGIQLDPLLVAVCADRLVLRPGRGDRVEQPLQKLIQIVVTKLQGALRFALITQIAHAQTGGIRQITGVIALIRNFTRYSWLLMYLFGASPAVSKAFMANKPAMLEPLGDDTCYLPYATSL
ncbi:MAG: hypothetical protein EON54_18885, partial [Alcaligenaceae bacterium]